MDTLVLIAIRGVTDFYGRSMQALVAFSIILIAFDKIFVSKGRNRDSPRHKISIHRSDPTASGPGPCLRREAGRPRLENTVL